MLVKITCGVCEQCFGMLLNCLIVIAPTGYLLQALEFWKSAARNLAGIPGSFTQNGATRCNICLHSFLSSAAYYNRTRYGSEGCLFHGLVVGLFRG